MFPSASSHHVSFMATTGLQEAQARDCVVQLRHGVQSQSHDSWLSALHPAASSHRGADPSYASLLIPAFSLLLFWDSITFPHRPPPKIWYLQSHKHCFISTILYFKMNSRNQNTLIDICFKACLLKVILQVVILTTEVPKLVLDTALFSKSNAHSCGIRHIWSPSSASTWLSLPLSSMREQLREFINLKYGNHLCVL